MSGGKSLQKILKFDWSLVRVLTACRPGMWLRAEIIFVISI